MRKRGIDVNLGLVNPFLETTLKLALSRHLLDILSKVAFYLLCSLQVLLLKRDPPLTFKQIQQEFRLSVTSFPLHFADPLGSTFSS